MIEDLEEDKREVVPSQIPEGIGNFNIIPFINTEKMSPVYLTREDIRDLGFLRSNPQRLVYKHRDKPTLFLFELYNYNFSVKDLVQYAIQIVEYKDINGLLSESQLYLSEKPNKEDIQQLIDRY